ncbi:uncharacterized protein LOC135334183 isoform X2 [Halichondria panicea]|uniref:uncharacterized protein LOC135334183 isoform X2 n=1 Tax=Halichondria panicea TaxID=6063 RepID=UPI00312BAD9D
MMSEGFGSNFKPFSSPASIPGQSESSCSAGSYPSGAESTMFTGVPATSLEDNAVVPKTCSTNDMDHAVTVDHTGYVMMPHLSRSGSDQSLDSGTAMEDVICKCPCGRTDFSHILNPLPDCLANRHSDSRSFPELDMKSSNKIAQDQLKMKLKRQTRIIKQEFRTFGLAVRRYAKSIPDVESILKECLSLDGKVVEALDFESLYPKFREGADLINFDILSRCLTDLKSYDDTGEENELRRLAEEAAEKYEASFQEFSQQQVVLVPTILQDANGRSNSMYKELKIKVEEDFRSFLVERLLDFKEVLKRILKLAPDVYLRVTSVREGCVEICFEMIGLHADTHISLNDVQKQELLANKITLLEYDGQVSYCCCELCSDESSRDTIKKVYNAVCLADYQKDEVDDVDGSNEHTLDCPCLSPQASIENVCSMEECSFCGIRLRRCSLEYHLLQCKRSDSSCPSSSDESDIEELPCAKQNWSTPLIAAVIELLSSRAMGDLATKRFKALLTIARSHLYYPRDIHTAARVGDLSALQHAIRRGDDVNSVDKDGYTPLMWAAMGGHTDTVRGLLSSGAVVDLADKNGWTPLTWAAIGGHTDTVRELLSSGAVVDLADENGWTPLMWAVIGGHTDTVRELLSSGAVVDLADKSEKALATSPVDPTHETTGQLKQIKNVMGFDCEFLDLPPQNLQIDCPVCFQTIREPHQVTCCGKRFCKACIQRVQDSKSSCPTCKATAFNCFPDKGIKQSLYRLKVICSHQKDGCEWTGELRQLDKHLNTDPLPEKQLDGCQFVEINCIYNCGNQLQRRYIQNHQTKDCPKRPFGCEHCHDYKSTYDDVTNNHWPICESFPVPCPNQCGSTIQRQNIDSHVADECPLTTINCDFHHVGCAVKLPRQDMPEHLRENLLTHISLLATNNAKQQEQIANQNFDIKTQQLQISVLVAENDELSRRNTILHAMIQSNTTRMAKLEPLQQALKTAPSNVNPRPLGQLGPPVLTMSNFEQYKKDNHSWWSPPVYTHPQGYKICLSVIANGTAAGKGTHVSLGVQFMRGEFDDSLKWPFRGIISVRLLNQVNSKEHETYSITYLENMDDLYCSRVTEGERGGGWGPHKFIALSKLEPEYLQSNTLLFQIYEVDINVS